MFFASIVCMLLGADPSFTEIDQEISEGRRTKNGTNVYTLDKMQTSLIGDKFRQHGAVLFQKTTPVIVFRYFEPLNQSKDDTIFVSVVVDQNTAIDLSSFGDFPLRIIADSNVVQLKVDKEEINRKEKTKRYISMSTAAAISKAFKDRAKSIDYRFADLEIKPSREVNDQILDFLNGSEAFREAMSRK